MQGLCLRWLVPTKGDSEIKNFNSMCSMLPQTYTQGLEVGHRKEFLTFSGKEEFKESFLEEVLSKVDFTIQRRHFQEEKLGEAHEHFGFGTRES